MPVKETKPHDTEMTVGVDLAQANPALRPGPGHKRCRPWGKGGSYQISRSHSQMIEVVMTLQPNNLELFSDL